MHGDHISQFLLFILSFWLKKTTIPHYSFQHPDASFSVIIIIMYLSPYPARQNMSSIGAIRHPPRICFPSHNPYQFVPKQKRARTSKTRIHASPRYKPKAAMETPNFPLNNTFPATTTSQPNTSNQTPTTHHPEQKTKLPSHPPAWFFFASSALAALASGAGTVCRGWVCEL